MSLAKTSSAANGVSAAAKAPLSIVQFDGTEQLKQAMRHVAATVSVITAGTDDRTGATVTSATALSVDPPTMIVNINRSSSSWPVIARHGHFCVNILSDDQQDIADRFAGKGGLRGPARYDGAEWTTLASGAPVLSDALSAIDCEVEHIIEHHTHAIIIGRVLAIRQKEGAPLLYHNGGYGTFRG
ncbi:flavin reductase (DIM6/NTAB) family NADH-FMN oxidoreductase RutF [Rhizobium sp. PP-F2F-G38]|uniref:Flavin reductase family protein n=1 Tax=Ferranicluibacter rubi TaxID=2715133 RepID=A0AA43ZF37_9HYPH|nr:flavin reductase family protein [Ferranicluibacter rubi]NHT76469.1 flavin reductase family protein [Ferranicluibacter rubi]PYE37494.1 flavin reductase (DIM6/NTAB) family NADH-FMN oxidoreductase RutF [Rhizobium sp. PP-WC-1G-195]PYF00946.1 flavin reductase (DIM6/NTAB) family NADH-FMN oxidoreductase RutF [Rhizobium sp. PP-F2F-G38]TCQ27732.1 flavin reductase (DIM6/NTAB) family NADH-FMN oxidoreductase RutF [Rhizobium sp. PP-CC-3G-465]